MSEWTKTAVINIHIPLLIVSWFLNQIHLVELKSQKKGNLWPKVGPSRSKSDQNYLFCSNVVGRPGKRAFLSLYFINSWCCGFERCSSIFSTALPGNFQIFDNSCINSSCSALLAKDPDTCLISKGILPTIPPISHLMDRRNTMFNFLTQHVVVSSIME